MAFATGTGWVRLPLIIHAISGLVIVVLIPWKSVIVRRGLARNRGQASTSSMLMLMVGIAILSGLLFSVAGIRSYGPLTAMQVHVGAGVLSLPLAVAHVWQRPVRPTRVDVERRNLLRIGGVLGVSGISYLALTGGTRLFRLPGHERRATGSYARGSGNPSAMPVTSWLDDSTPRIDPSEWRLVASHADDVTTYQLEDLAVFTDEVTAILDCTGGWFSEQTWGGVWLNRLVDIGNGSSVLVTSATGYRRRFPIGDSDRLLLATTLGGEPLSPGHGFPVRLVAPGRRGFWWVKWVQSIEIDDRPWWWQSPFPLT